MPTYGISCFLNFLFIKNILQRYWFKYVGLLELTLTNYKTGGDSLSRVFKFCFSRRWDFPKQNQLVWGWHGRSNSSCDFLCKESFKKLSGTSLKWIRKSNHLSMLLRSIVWFVTYTICHQQGSATLLQNIMIIHVIALVMLS